MKKKIYYGLAVYDQKEINAVNNVLKNKKLTLIDGPLVKEFEKEVAKLFGKKYGLMVNSGSSANLLALASLKLKKNSDYETSIDQKNNFDDTINYILSYIIDSHNLSTILT